MTGWAVGTYGQILKTTDGGTTWTAQASGTTETFVKDFSFRCGTKMLSSEQTERF